MKKTDSENKTSAEQKDPRVKHLRKIRKIWLFCISFSVIVAAIGNMVPSNWKGDFGILAIIFAALFIAYFAYYIFLEKT